MKKDVPQNVPQKLTTRQAKILELITWNSKISSLEMAEKFSVTSKTIKRELKTLGISWEGPSKTGHWVIKRSNK